MRAKILKKFNNLHQMHGSTAKCEILEVPLDMVVKKSLVNLTRPSEWK